MEYVLIYQSLFVRINRSDELSMWRIKRSQLYSTCLRWFCFELVVLNHDSFNIYGSAFCLLYKSAMLTLVFPYKPCNDYKSIGEVCRGVTVKDTNVVCFSCVFILDDTFCRSDKK